MNLSHRNETIIEEEMILMTPTEKRCRPDFWIIGTRKGGTTNLYTQMAQHPRVASLHIKGRPQDGEVFVLINNQTLRKYNRKFKQAPLGTLVGDSSVSRIVTNDREMTATCGHKYVKYIVLLRDPIERCHSQILMRSRLKTNGMNAKFNISKEISKQFKNFQKVIGTQSNSTKWATKPYPNNLADTLNCVNVGIYVAQLKRWLYHASITNVRIYFLEDFKMYPEEVVKNALQFIGVSSTEIQNFKLRLLTQPANSRPVNETLLPHQQITPQLRR